MYIFHLKKMYDSLEDRPLLLSLGGETTGDFLYIKKGVPMCIV